MKLSNKKALGFIVFVFFVLIALLFFNQSIQSNYFWESKKIRDHQKSQVVGLTKNYNSNQLSDGIKFETYNYLSDYSESMVISQTVINEVKGRIEEVSISDNTTLKSGLVSKLTITLSSGINNSKSKIFFNENNLRNIKVFDQKKGKALNYSELETGDDIIIREVLDLKKTLSDSRSEIVITKI